jgi:hypothetical protein
VNCRHVRKKLALHAGDDLDARESAAVSAHLTGCLSCYREFVELRDMVSTVRAAGGPRVRGDAESEALVASVMREIHGPPPPAPQLLPRLALVSGWAAALLLGVTLAWPSFFPAPTPPVERPKPVILEGGGGDPRLRTIENERELQRQIDELNQPGASRAARPSGSSRLGPTSPPPIVVQPRKRNL